MAHKTYRTALGKQVDMGSLISKNETVRAVGNMGVNARGDVVNNKNESTTPRNAQVNNHYRKQIQNQIVDVPVGTAVSVEAQDDLIEGLDTPNTPDIVSSADTDTNASNNTESNEVKPHTTKKTGGLASAIAKAREVEQKKLKTPREEARGKTGVNKI